MKETVRHLIGSSGLCHVLKTLDQLALALKDAGHIWTSEEKFMYESSSLHLLDCIKDSFAKDAEAIKELKEKGYLTDADAIKAEALCNLSTVRTHYVTT